VYSGSTKSYFSKPFEGEFVSSSKRTDATILTANNTSEKVMGEMDVCVTVGTSSSTVNFRLAPSIGYDCVLGIDFLKLFEFTIDFGLGTWKTTSHPITKFAPASTDSQVVIEGFCAGLVEVDEVRRSEIESLLTIIKRTPSEGVRMTSLSEHAIDVEGHPPIRQSLRRYSPKVVDATNEAVDKLLDQDITEHYFSPWNSCPVLVPKKDNTYRFCVDYRRLNDVTRKNAHPLPNIDSILDRLRNARFISKIDMSQAFHQIPVAEGSRDYTAFSVPGLGQFRYKRMPYGLTNAPATFQEAMDRFVRTKLPPEAADVIFVYLDDFCLVTHTYEDHVSWLKILLDAIQDANLQINWEKSEFCCRQIKYLGFVIDENGLHTDQDKVQAINDYPPPKTIKQLRRFLGMVGWYSRFLANFAEDKVPLCHLLKKDVSWHWNDEQRQAFQKLKDDLVSAPVLVRPDFSKKFYLHCDASDFCVSGTLMQKDDEGHDHAITYINKILSSRERKWTTTEKECYAVIWSLEKLRPYIEGYSFVVYTDHSSLIWLKNLKDVTRRLGRWAMKLLAYDVEIQHRPGRDNKVPDALSRAYESVIAALEDFVTQDGWYLRKFKDVSSHPDRFPD